jgi:hypothetical protein
VLLYEMRGENRRQDSFSEASQQYTHHSMALALGCLPENLYLALKYSRSWDLCKEVSRRLLDTYLQRTYCMAVHCPQADPESYRC